MKPGLLAVLFLALSGALALAAAPRWSWQEPQAKVLPTGDLQWAPQPFVFTPGNSVRYLDFEQGRDTNPGTKAQPWQHHPWDPNATDRAKAGAGPHTYVFKRGVTYRGVLRATDVRDARLTSDPAWGSGEAVLAGSVRVSGPWHRADASTAPKVPQPEKEWYCDFAGEQPRLLWEVRGQEVARLPSRARPTGKRAIPTISAVSGSPGTPARRATSTPPPRVGSGRPAPPGPAMIPSTTAAPPSGPSGCR